MSGQPRATGPEAPLSLAGNGVLVAGFGGPLAESIAGECAGRGARVALATPGEVHQHTGVFSLRTPLETDADIEALFEALPLRLPRLDIVIAVITAEPLGLTHEVSLDDWRGRVEKPLRKTFSLVSRAVEELLVEGTPARFVLVVDSAADEDSGPDDLVENALQSFVRSFAREYGRRGLSCNLVSARKERRTDETRLPSIIEHALFLASPEASFINGEWLAIGAARDTP